MHFEPVSTTDLSTHRMGNAPAAQTLGMQSPGQTGSVREAVYPSMGSSHLITLFSEPARPKSGLSPFVVSILLHASFFSVLTAKVIQNHRIIERFPRSHFGVRVLDFHSTQPQMRQAASASVQYHGPIQATKPSTPKPAPGGSSGGAPSVTSQTAKLMPAPQTLIQPDVPPDLVAFKKIPIPLAVLWSPEKPVVQKRLVPPAPDKAAIAVVRPSIDTPINEENLAEFRVASTVIVKPTPAAPPSTTSPIVVHGPEEVQKVPQTTSQPPDHAAPTPARILSLSDTRVAEGSVVIPQVNESSAKVAPGSTDRKSVV